MADDVYGGSLNWDRIYRIFHCADMVATRLDQELGEEIEPVVFTGFPKSASDLAHKRPTNFVDMSHAVISSAREAYPNLERLTTSDALAYLSSCDAPHLVLSGRVTAFWDTNGVFDQFKVAALSYPRQKIIVDFFDTEQFPEAGTFSFASDKGHGEWKVLSKCAGSTTCPEGTVIKLRICYRLDELDTVFETEWCSFQKSQILQWGMKHFEGYAARIAPSLIDGDPSFTLTMTQA